MPSPDGLQRQTLLRKARLIGSETLAPNPETSLSIRREMLRVKIWFHLILHLEDPGLSSKRRLLPLATLERCNCVLHFILCKQGGEAATCTPCYWNILQGCLQGAGALMPDTGIERHSGLGGTGATFTWQKQGQDGEKDCWISQGKSCVFYFEYMEYILNCGVFYFQVTAAVT